jgi:hypothetical protein
MKFPFRKFEKQKRRKMAGIEAITMPDGRSQLKSDGSGSVPRNQGVLVKPDAGFVIKTRLHSNSSTDRMLEVSTNRTQFEEKDSDHNISLSSLTNKVFINVCFHDAVAQPKIQKKLDETGNEVEGLNVPLSIGQTRSCMDKTGSNHCLIVDVILSSTVKTQIENERKGKGLTAYRDFICDIVIQSVEEKYRNVHGNIDREFKLPKIDYIGYSDSRTGEVSYKKSEHAGILSQWVKDCRDQPTIEEVQPMPSGNVSSVKNIVDSSKLTQVLTSHLILIEFSSKRRVSLLELRKILEEQTSFKSISSQSCNDNDDFLCISEDILQSMTELIEAIVIEVTFSSHIHFPTFKVTSSAYQIICECESFAPLVATLPFVVTSSSVTCTYFEEHLKAVITAHVARNISTIDPDIGTSQWKLKHVVSNQERCTEKGCKKTSHQLNSSSPSSKETMKCPENNDSCAKLPEDTFHVEDALSMFNIDQQRGVRNDTPDVNLMELF